MRILIALMLLACLSPGAWAVPVAQKEFDLVLKRTPNATRGASLYETCAACHGSKGEGVRDGSVPALAGQSFTVLAKQLVDFRAGVRGDPRMAHFTDTRHLAYSQDIADVAAFIASLASVSRQTPSKQSTTRVAMLYTRSCERCHGASAEGKEDSLAPRLASQHSEYLLRQLDDAVEGRRPAMAGTHAGLVRALPRDDVKALVEYLSATP
jgi:cytochrome c oxidase subunit 2